MDWTSEVSRITEEILSRLDHVNSTREHALAEARQLTRLCANAVQAIHRREFALADDLLARARVIKDQLTADLARYPSLYWSGYVQDAHKEFAEASVARAIIGGGSLPGPDTLGVDDAVYLNALGEAAGELRRYVLDTIRQGDLIQAEAMLLVMDEIYRVLVLFNYPDAITYSLRRTTDMVRGVVERTRGDVTLAVEHRKLSDALARMRELLVDRPRPFSER